MALSSPPHPALSVRPLLSTFDTFVTDSQLEALYDRMYPIPICPNFPPSIHEIHPSAPPDRNNKF